MSRTPPTREPLRVKPSNDIYTVLVIVATLVVVLGLIVVIARSYTLFPDGIF